MSDAEWNALVAESRDPDDDGLFMLCACGHWDHIDEVDDATGLCTNCAPVEASD
jgi:hypothetical protein